MLLLLLLRTTLSSPVRNKIQHKEETDELEKKKIANSKQHYEQSNNSYSCSLTCKPVLLLFCSDCFFNISVFSLFQQETESITISGLHLKMIVFSSVWRIWWDLWNKHTPVKRWSAGIQEKVVWESTNIKGNQYIYYW